MQQATHGTRAASRGIAAVPKIIGAPLVAAILLAIPGAIGWATGYPLLFPSLGPTALLHAASPQLPSARFYNTLMGHLIGIGCAFLAVWLLGAESEPSVLTTNVLLPLRLWATLLAIALLIVGQILLKASHPPAAATALLITLGGFHLAWRDTLVLASGVALVAIVGEPLRRLCLRME